MSIQAKARAEQRPLDADEVARLYGMLQAMPGADAAVRVPLLILNGTSVETGCRFNGSVLTLAGHSTNEPSGRCLAPLGLEAPLTGTLAATVDLVDMLCPGQDIRLSTVALLSSRFPYVSPSGHLKRSCSSGTAGGPETYVVDGGYLDGTGSSTLLGLWDMLAPLVDEHNRDPLSRAFIVPFVIQIDNGYAEPSSPGPAPADPQLLTPPKTLLTSWDASKAVSRQQLQLLFSKPFAVQLPPSATPAGGEGAVRFYRQSRYVLFALRSHPGPEARTGWVLSNVAFSDLVHQFTQSGGCNAAAAYTVEQWFGSLQLSPTPPADGTISPPQCGKGQS